MAGPYAGTFDPSHRFVTSWLLPPAALFAVRALLSLYAFVTLFTIFGWNGSHGASESSRQSFSYFTNLTYWGLGFYTAVSALHTATYWRSGEPLLAKWPKSLQIAHSIFYSTVVVYPWVVTAVYWGLLAPSSFDSTLDLWSNVSRHVLNSLYALFELVVPRTEPLPWVDVVAIVLLLALYLGLAYLTHHTQGFYVYGFLDPQKHSPGVVAGYIMGILVVSVLVFIIVRYLILLRVWVTEKKLGKLGKFSARDRSAGVDSARKPAEEVPLRQMA